MRKRHLLGIILTLGIMTGCGSNNTVAVTPSTPNNSANNLDSNASDPKKVVPSETPDPKSTVIPASSGKEVTFNIKIDKSALSNKRDIELRLYNDEQMKITEKTSSCTVSYNAVTKTEGFKCADGVEYQKPSPEVFKFKFDEIKEAIVVKSATVKIGQKFLLSLSGLSSDNCNTAGARIEKANAAETENITGLEWASTQMACLN